MSDTVEVFEAAGQKFRLTPDEAALVVYADRNYRNDSVAIHISVGSSYKDFAILQFMERTFNGQTCCVVVVPRIPMDGKSQLLIRVKTKCTVLHEADIWQTLFAGQVMELDYRGLDRKQVEKEEAAKAPVLQVDVAGSTFSMKEHEAALVVYADPNRRGLNVTLSHLLADIGLGKSGYVDATFTLRNAGGETICAAIIPRIDLRKWGGNGSTENCQVKIINFYSPTYTGDYERNVSGSDRDYSGNVTLYAGNVAELDLRKD